MGRTKGTHSRKKAGPSGESQIQAALAFLATLDDINYSAAAQKFSVNVCTLRRRFLGKTRSRSAAHARQRILTDIQEDVILDWMCFHAEEGRPWGKEKLKVKVKKLTGREPSDEWVKRFQARHRDVLKFCGTSGLDPKRCQAFNKTTICNHFKTLGEAMKKHKYRIALNVDETGMQRGGGRKRTGKKHFVSRQSRAKYKKRDANLELVTIIECACSDGTMLDPGFVFQGKTYEEDWFRNYPNISVGLTQNGWTDDLQCLRWFRHTFIPQARAKTLTPEEPILLIFDGHGSHLTGELHQTALEHNVHLFMLPAHTTNKTQPLDVGIFGPLSRKWIARNEEIVEETGAGMQKYRFVDEYMEVRRAAITPDIIHAAFRKTGIWPFNPDVFDDEDFAPSRTTSIIAHMPPSYPSPQAPGASSAASSSASSSSLAISSETDNRVLTSSVQRALSHSHVDPPPQPIETSSLLTIPGSQGNSGPTNDASTCSSGCLSTDMIPAFSRSHIDKRWSPQKQNQVLAMDIRTLEELYYAEFVRRQALEVQCELVRHENGALRIQLHHRAEAAEGRKGKQLQTEAQFLMSEEALSLFAQKRQDTETRQQAEQQRLVEKERTERETTSRRARLATDPSVRFSGSLKGKRKTELEDIAFLLCIPLGATASNLIEAIKNTLNDTATQHKRDPRFAGLYNLYNFKDDEASSGASVTAPDVENFHPASSSASSSLSLLASAATENVPPPSILIQGRDKNTLPSPNIERPPFAPTTNAPAFSYQRLVHVPVSNFRASIAQPDEPLSSTSALNHSHVPLT